MLKADPSCFLYHSTPCIRGSLQLLARFLTLLMRPPWFLSWRWGAAVSAAEYQKGEARWKMLVAPERRVDAIV